MPFFNGYLKVSKTFLDCRDLLGNNIMWACSRIEGFGGLSPLGFRHFACLPFPLVPHIDKFKPFFVATLNCERIRVNASAVQEEKLGW
jgi:hypothetical protein